MVCAAEVLTVSPSWPQLKDCDNLVHAGKEKEKNDSWLVVVLLRFLGRGCLGKVDLLVAGGATEVLQFQSPSIAPPLPCHFKEEPIRLHYFNCCFFILAGMGATSTASGRLEVNLFWKRGGKSHFGIIKEVVDGGLKKGCF